jgi:hypothetical protein
VRINKISWPEVTTRKLMSFMAAAGATTSISQNAEAIDFFNSGPITTNNLVGVSGATIGLSTFKLNLDGAGAGAAITRNSFYSVFFAKSVGNANVPYFKVGTYTRPANGGFGPLANAVKTFAPNATWAQAGVAVGSKGMIGKTKSGNNELGKVDPAATNKYLLFRFKDASAVVYNGWVNIDYQNDFLNTLGNGLFLWAKVNSYAWQANTTGVLGAGQTAVTGVPEPSTIVTTGIAALTGGAIALRRWRKERKAAQSA